MERERVQTWLRKNAHLINNSAFDREVGSPKGTLQKYMKYGKKLNDKYIKNLDKVIKEMSVIDKEETRK